MASLDGVDMAEFGVNKKKKKKKKKKRQPNEKFSLMKANQFFQAQLNAVWS